MVKEKKSTPNRKKRLRFILLLILFKLLLLTLFLTFFFSFIYYFEKTYQNKVYPGVKIDGMILSGKTKEEVEQYFLEKSKPLSSLNLTLTYGDKMATLSGQDLKIAYDEKLSSIQASSIGRSGSILSDTYQKWRAATLGINLSSVLRMNSLLIEETVDNLALGIDIPPQDALFQFEKGKVAVFRLSKQGRKVNKEQTKKIIFATISEIAKENTTYPNLNIDLVVETLLPAITTENSNQFGIKELLGKGNSKFVGSIPGRVHNIELATSRINGRLIPPGDEFSFNNTLGDVSAATGFQPAYIIKEGRTVLGDGGGVCQVSTTLFRAAINTGLPIVERHAHAYRVSYYEQDSGPGLDATVFDPTHDLKFKNDTLNHLLIQAKTNLQDYTLTFELYGTNDGRKVEITKPVVMSQTPPPDDLYQDDPTLPKGVVKQVDWKAWGARVNFDYKVTRNGETINQQSFFSNFKPWQAVFLRGTRE